MRWNVEVAPGDNVAAALKACSFFEQFPAPSSQGLLLGVWAKAARLEDALQDGDRVEIYRALKVDPKMARRLRFGQQGAKSAGLFSATRPGAKAGY